MVLSAISCSCWCEILCPTMSLRSRRKGDSEKKLRKKFCKKTILKIYFPADLLNNSSVLINPSLSWSYILNRNCSLACLEAASASAPELNLVLKLLSMVQNSKKFTRSSEVAWADVCLSWEKQGFIFEKGLSFWKKKEILSKIVLQIFFQKNLTDEDSSAASKTCQ